MKEGGGEGLTRYSELGSQNRLQADPFKESVGAGQKIIQNSWGDRGGGQGYSELRGVGVVKKIKIDFQIRVRGYLDFGG